MVSEPEEYIEEKAFLECVPYNDEYYKISFLIEKGYAKGLNECNDTDINDIKKLSINRFYDVLEISCKLRELIIGLEDYEHDVYEDAQTSNYIDTEVNKIKQEYDIKIKKLKDEHDKKINEVNTVYVEDIYTYDKEINQYKDNIEELKKDYEKRLSILQKEKDALKTEKSRLLTTVQEKEDAINIFKGQVEKFVMKAIEPLKNTHKEEIMRMEAHYKEEKTRMEKQSNDEKNRIENMGRSEILRLETSYKSMIELIEKTNSSENEKLKRKIEEGEARIEELYNELKCSQVSSVKGSIGQTDFIELVKQHTDWTNVEDTSKTARAGDVRGYIGKVDTLFEIKNYTSDVPTREVIKFIRDMEVHSNIPYGVFISMNSGIANKKGNITFQWTSYGQLCIFFSNFLKTDVDMSLKYIGECASIGQRFFSLNNDEDNDKIEFYKEKIVQIKTIITKQLSEVSEMMASMTQHKKLQLDNITKHYTEYKMGLDKMKVSCNEIIDIIIGEPTDEVVVEEIVEVEEKKGRGKKKAKISE